MKVRLEDRVLTLLQRQTLKVIAWRRFLLRRLPFGGGHAFSIHFMVGEHPATGSIESLRKRRWIKFQGTVELTPRGWIALSQLLLEEWPA